MFLSHISDHLRKVSLHELNVKKIALHRMVTHEHHSQPLFGNIKRKFNGFHIWLLLSLTRLWHVHNSRFLIFDILLLGIDWQLIFIVYFFVEHADLNWFHGIVKSNHIPIKLYLQYTFNIHMYLHHPQCGKTRNLLPAIFFVKSIHSKSL